MRGLFGIKGFSVYFSLFWGRDKKKFLNYLIIKKIGFKNFVKITDLLII